MHLLFLDIETRGSVPVTEHGVYRHVQDPTLRLLCVSYALADQPVRTWRCAFAGDHPDHFEPLPDDLRCYLKSPDVMIVAWNAGYERIVLNAVRGLYGLPELAIERFVCAAAWAAAHALPRSLDDCSRYLLSAERRKSGAGKLAARLWDARLPMTADDREVYEVGQVEYCERDVEAMRDIWELLLEPPSTFLAEYHAAERINDRGMLYDGDLIDAAIRLAPRVDEEIRADLDRLTGGAVKPRGPSMLQWLQRELPPELVGMLTVQKKRRKDLRWWTEERLSTDRGVRAKLLEELKSWEGCDDVVQVLDLYDEANKAAVTKFKAAKARMSDDGAIRGAYVFNGATTGRFSSTGIQMHNLLRATAKDPEKLIHQLKTAPYDALPGLTGMSVNRALSMSVRPGIEADDGCAIVWGDWSAIEARALPWLSGDPAADELLAMFARGEDVYIAEASSIYGIEPQAVTKDQRQAGKVAILSLGFAGAVGALTAMARNYGISFSEAEARYIVEAWRRKNTWATSFWKAIRMAIDAAIENPEQAFQAGRVTYTYQPHILRGSLLAILPCGRPLVYPNARFEDVDKYGRVSRSVVYDHPVYGANELAITVASENITQAAAASLLRDTLVRMQDVAIAHTHDEVVIEVPEGEAEAAADRLRTEMTTTPWWAGGLPLAAEVEVGFRYKVPWS